MKPTLRPATAADIPAITAIYRPAVLDGTASFELEPPSEAEMLRRFEAITEAGYPYFVAELDGRVAGYAYASAYRTRPGYRFTVENSVYIAPDAQGKGVGRALLDRADRHLPRRRLPPDDRRHRRLRQLRLHHPAPPRRLQVLRHHPLGRLQVRPLARQRLMELPLGEGDTSAPAERRTVR